MQDLVCAESIKPQLSPTQVLPLIEQAVDGVVHLFEANGISLRPSLPDSCPLILVNGARTLAAMSQVLILACSLSRPRDTVEITVWDDSPSGVGVEVRNLEMLTARLKGEMRLGMVLAEAIVRNQRGSMSWSLQPFTVRFIFRKAPEGEPA
jgi:signal transduction histidine kinase